MEHTRQIAPYQWGNGTSKSTGWSSSMSKYLGWYNGTPHFQADPFSYKLWSCLMILYMDM
jgi:hypothetical protein